MLWFENLKKFASFYKRHMKLFVLDMSAGVCHAGVSTFIPFVAYKLINDYLPNRNFDYLIWGSILLLFMNVFLVFFEYIGLRWGHIMGARIETDMREELFIHLQKLSFSYYDKTKTGNLMSRLTNDLNIISETAHHAPEDFIISILTFVGAFSVMFYLNPLLASITLIPLPFVILWGARFRITLHQGFREIRIKIAEINTQVENSIQGIREVKSYGNEERQIKNFTTTNNNFLKIKERVCSLLANFHCGFSFLMSNYTLLFVVAGVILIYNNKATMAELLAFMMYSRYVTFPIHKLINFTEQTQNTAAAFGRAQEVMNEMPEIVDAPDAIELSNLKGKLSFVDTYFKYDGIGEDEDWIIDGISLDIREGKTIALVGESGAGKSTIAALVPRFYELNKGDILLDGVDIRKIKQRFLHDQIGIVQQTPFLFDSTIKENILIGNPNATEEEMIEASKAANIFDFIDSLPDKFDSQVGEHGVRLSGGQRQRISIARVFLKNPSVLIFDEATSALDNESEALVQEALERLCAERTTIIIAHRLSTVKSADYIYCLRNGKVVESGSHSSLIELGGYYKELYTMHSF